MSPTQIEYFVARTDERLESIEQKIDALSEFRAKTLAETQLVAFVVSGVCGFLSMLVCGIITYFVTTKVIQ